MRLLRRQIVQRQIRFAGAGIVEDRVALAEGAAAAVLAAQPHRRPFQQQRAERQQLRRTPSRSACGPEIPVCASSSMRRDLRMDREVFRRSRQALDDGLQQLLAARRSRPARASSARSVPSSGRRSRACSGYCGRPGAHLFQRVLQLGLNLLVIASVSSTVRSPRHDELFGVHFGQRRADRGSCCTCNGCVYAGSSPSLWPCLR